MYAGVYCQPGINTFGCMINLYVFWGGLFCGWIGGDPLACFDI